MPSHIDLLEQLADSLAGDPAFMAWALAHYRAEENLATLALLGERLGTDRLGLARLALCKRVHSRTADFAARVREVAAVASVDASTLASLLRQVEFSVPLSVAPSADGKLIPFPAPASVSTPLLAAARDREESEGRGALPPPTHETR